MDRFLVIDPDRAAVRNLGVACLSAGVGVAIAENVCEGVRVLLNESVSLIVVEAQQLRLGARERATLFQRVASGVPVVVVVGSTTPLELRVALELDGFRVMARPVAVGDLLEMAAAAAS